MLEAKVSRGGVLETICQRAGLACLPRRRQTRGHGGFHPSLSPIGWKDLRTRRALGNRRARLQNAEGQRTLEEADLEEEVRVLLQAPAVPARSPSSLSHKDASRPETFKRAVAKNRTKEALPPLRLA